jgi:hypothetical protein
MSRCSTTATLPSKSWFNEWVGQREWWAVWCTANESLLNIISCNLYAFSVRCLITREYATGWYKPFAAKVFLSKSIRVKCDKNLKCVKYLYFHVIFRPCSKGRECRSRAKLTELRSSETMEGLSLFKIQFGNFIEWRRILNTWRYISRVLAALQRHNWTIENHGSLPHKLNKV